MLLNRIKQQVEKLDVPAATLAGLAAGGAYAATMEIDTRLAGRKLDDALMLGRFFLDDQRQAKLLGLGLHSVNAISLAWIYAGLARDHLPGPPWLRGVIYANIENTVLYPAGMLVDRHPMVKEGEVPPYWTFSSYLLSIPRHVAYGATLGPLYERLRRSNDQS